MRSPPGRRAGVAASLVPQPRTGQDPLGAISQQKQWSVGVRSGWEENEGVPMAAIS
jgi:hypothetical protein